MTVVAMDEDRFNDMEKVAELTMMGTGPQIIAKQLGMTRIQVKKLQEQYREILSQDSEARDMARDHLNMMVKHYDSLIKKFYDLIDEIDFLDFNHQVAAQKNATLRSIAELEAKRLDALQKAGLLDSAELGDELADAEAKRAVLIDIIKSEVCPACRMKIAQKISYVSGQTEPVEVVDAEIVGDSK